MALYLIRGLPGSGKTTLAREFNMCYFEADQFFLTPSGEYVFDGEKIGEAHEWCQNLVDLSLDSGEDVVVANTFVEKWELEPYLAMAEKYDTRVTIITCEGNYGNVHGVPEEVIEGMRQRWERL